MHTAPSVAFATAPAALVRVADPLTSMSRTLPIRMGSVSVSAEGRYVPMIN